MTLKLKQLSKIETPPLSLSVTINSIGQMQWGLLLASAVQAKVSNQITVHVTQVM